MNVLEAFLKKSGSRKRRAIENMSLLDMDWDTEHAHAFQDLQAQIQDAAKVSHRKKDWSICVFTDASDANWAGVATLCHPSELIKPHKDLIHQPLAFKLTIQGARKEVEHV